MFNVGRARGEFDFPVSAASSKRSKSGDTDCGCAIVKERDSVSRCESDCRSAGEESEAESIKNLNRKIYEHFD